MSRAVMKEGEEFIDLQHLISTELWHESMKFTRMTNNESVKLTCALTTPVIHQNHAKDVILCLVHADWLSQLVAGAD